MKKRKMPKIKKVVNSKLPHAVKQAVKRGVFSSYKEANRALKGLSKQITRNGFPKNGYLRPLKNK